MAFDLNLKLKCHGTHDYDPLTYFRHIKSLLHSQFTFPFCGESSSLWWPANIQILTRWKTTPFACNSHGKSNQTNWSGINRWKLKLIPRVSYLLKELRCAALLEIEITLNKEKKNQYLPFEWLSVVSSYRIENGSLKREKGKNLVRTHAMRESISFLSRAQNNGQSTDNVWTDWGFDWSTCRCQWCWPVTSDCIETEIN